MEIQLSLSLHNRAVYIVPPFILIIIGIYWFNAIPSENVGQAENTEKLPIDFIGTDLSGNIFEGASLKGKTVLLDFWAVWCGPCIEAFPGLNKMNRELKSENFEVIGMTLYSGTSEDVKVITDEHSPNYKILLLDNDEMLIRYDVIGFPTYYLIDPGGKIYKKYVGQVGNFFDKVKSDVDYLNSKYNDINEVGSER